MLKKLAFPEACGRNRSCTDLAALPWDEVEALMSMEHRYGFPLVN